MTVRTPLFAITVAVGLAGAQPADAAVLIASGTWTNISFGQIAKFDPSLGTLNSITVEMVVRTGGSYFQSAYGAFGIDGTFSGSLATTIGAASYTGTVRHVGWNGTDSVWVEAIGRSTTQVAASDWDRFVGQGDLTILPVEATAGTFAFNNRAGFGFIDGTRADRTIRADFRVIYDYALASAQAVPEPATWAMMIGGFGLVGAAIRRRRRPGTAIAA